MASADPKRTALLEAELQRLEREHAVLDRQWNRKHWLGGFALLAIPAAYWGFAYVFMVLLLTPSLIAVQSYLLAVRRNECRELMAEAKHELASLRRAGA